MSFDQFPKRSEEAIKCISPVIHQLNTLGDAAYGGHYYDNGDMEVLHINITSDIR